RDEILSSELGRRYRTLIEKHVNEVTYLANRVRPVTVAWRRMHGPEFLGHILHASRHAQYVVPREIYGIERDAALSHVLETLSRHGSQMLRDDIERNADQVRALFGQIDDMETLADRLHRR